MADAHLSFLNAQPNIYLSPKQSPIPGESLDKRQNEGSSRHQTFFGAEHRRRTQFWRGFGLLRSVQSGTVVAAVVRLGLRCGLNFRLLRSV
jgi:hypothetical protein